jgi:hypothetical protein
MYIEKSFIDTKVTAIFLILTNKNNQLILNQLNPIKITKESFFQFLLLC